MEKNDLSIARREFLRFVAASPYVAAQIAAGGGDVIKDPSSALNVMDF